MNKKNSTLIAMLFVPAVACAHNPGGAMISMSIAFIISLIVSFPLLKLISRRYITIKNKFMRFLVLLIVELCLLFLLFVVLSLILGEFLYTYVFGG